MDRCHRREPAPTRTDRCDRPSSSTGLAGVRAGIARRRRATCGRTASRCRHRWSWRITRTRGGVRRQSEGGGRTSGRRRRRQRGPRVPPSSRRRSVRRSRPMLHHELAHEAMLAAIEARAGAEAALEACIAMTSAAVPDPLILRYRLMTAELLARAGRWDHCDRVLGQLPATPRRLLVEARVALGRHRAGEREVCSRQRTRAPGRCGSRSRQRCCNIGPSRAMSDHLRRGRRARGTTWVRLDVRPRGSRTQRRAPAGGRRRLAVAYNAARHGIARLRYHPDTGSSRTSSSRCRFENSRCWSCCRLTSPRSNWPDGSTSRPTRSARTSRRSTASSE